MPELLTAGKTLFLVLYLTRNRPLPWPTSESSRLRPSPMAVLKSKMFKIYNSILDEINITYSVLLLLFVVAIFFFLLIHSSDRVETWLSLLYIQTTGTTKNIFTIHYQWVKSNKHGETEGNQFEPGWAGRRLPRDNLNHIKAIKEIRK